MNTLPNSIWVEFDEFTIRTGSRTTEPWGDSGSSDEMLLRMKLQIVSNRTRRKLFELEINQVFNRQTEGSDVNLLMSNHYYNNAINGMMVEVVKNSALIEAKLFEERLEDELEFTQQQLQILEQQLTTPRKRL